MKRTMLLLLVAVVLFATSSSSADDPEALEKQFTRFLEWFPGRYDSALQVQTDALDALPEGERNYRRHSIFRRVELPAFGDVVFYAEQYRDGDPRRVYRQRIYGFSLDHDRDAIRLRVHVPNAVEGLRGAYRDPSLLDGLTPGDTKVWAGCDLWWQWEGERFRGSLDPGTCRFTSEAFGQEIVLDEHLFLGRNDIQFADRGLALDGSYLFGMRSDVPNISLRIRPFLCEVNVGAAASTHWIHDQGGEVKLPEGVLGLQRWNVTEASPHQGRGLRLMLSADSGAWEESAAGPVDAETISLTRDDLEVRCHHAPGAVYEESRQAGGLLHSGG